MCGPVTYPQVSSGDVIGQVFGGAATRLAIMADLTPEERETLLEFLRQARARIDVLIDSYITPPAFREITVTDSMGLSESFVLERVHVERKTLGILAAAGLYVADQVAGGPLGDLGNWGLHHLFVVVEAACGALS
jgi:hypothetical protein